MEALNVYLNGCKAGRLVDNNGEMSFSYLGDYLESNECEPLSYSVPLRADAFGHAEIEPFLSTAIYPEVGRRMAMKVDGEYAFKWISRDKFIRMANKTGIAQRIVSRELDKVIRRVKRALPAIAAKAGRFFPHRVYGTIAEGIAARMAQI